MERKEVNYVALKEIGATALGWFAFFSGYLAFAVAVITIMLVFKSGIDWRLAFPVFVKWEILMGVLAFSIANVVHLHKNYLQRFIPIQGFIRTSILYFLAYLLATWVVPYFVMFIPYAQIKVEELESNLAFVLIVIVILRVVPQKNYDDPKGPTLKLPVCKFERSAVKLFGFFNHGADFFQDWGTPVYAAGDGKVVAAWPYKGYGNMVKVNHADGFSTVYSQLGVVAVKYGQEVKTGDVIGYTGNTGDSYEPHLHFEVRYKNRVVDPGSYVPELKKEEDKVKSVNLPKAKGKKNKK